MKRKQIHMTMIITTTSIELKVNQLNKIEREYVEQLIRYYDVVYQDIHRRATTTPSICCRKLAKRFVSELRNIENKSLVRLKMECPKCNESEKIWIPLGHSYRPYVQCESCGTWFNPSNPKDNHRGKQKE